MIIREKHFRDPEILQLYNNYFIKKLIPEVRIKAKEMVSICEEEHFHIVINSSLRKLEEQAIHYRQSRTWEEIKQKIQQLRNSGFSFLSDIIEEVGPQEGPFMTNYAPGESWHNYAEAWDAVPYYNNKFIWDCEVNLHFWKRYGEAVRQVGMYWGGDMPQYEDYFLHAQLREDCDPLKVLSPDQVYYKLKKFKLLK